MPRGARAPTWIAGLLVLCGACAEPAYNRDKDQGADEQASRANDGGEAGTASERDAGPLSGKLDAKVQDVPASSRDDAETPRTSAPDADTSPRGPVELEPDPTPTTNIVPAWAAGMPGTYASRAYLFRQDDFGVVTRGEQIMLSQITPAEGGLVMRSKLCSYLATNWIADMKMVDPSGIPERLENVKFADTEQRWTTEGMPVSIGFTRELPQICKGKEGAAVSKPPAQVWSSSATCRCPDTSEPPMADDCRVLDPDGDQQPGLTFALKGTGVPGNYMLYGAIESDSRLSNGQLGADGSMTANVRAAETNYQLGCMPSDCADIAKLGKWCPSSRNHVQFVPLPAEAAPSGGYSCSSVLAALSKLFPTPPEEIPSACL